MLSLKLNVFENFGMKIENQELRHLNVEISEKNTNFLKGLFSTYEISAESEIEVKEVVDLSEPLEIIVITLTGEEIFFSS